MPFHVLHSSASTLNSSCRDKLPFMTTVRLLLPPPHPAASDPRADASGVAATTPVVLAGVAAALWRGAPWNTDAWKAVVPDTHPDVSPKNEACYD